MGKLNLDTPLAILTLRDLAAFLDYRLDKETSKTEMPETPKRYVYGLKGIQQLFNVSHTTAQIYKNGILKDAVYQSGRKIVVDVDKAIKLFVENK